MARKQQEIIVQSKHISILKIDTEDYICLTDMAKNFGDDAMIYQWMRNRNTVEFIGVWEQFHNLEFKGIEFETFKITVVNLFPDSQKFNSVTVTHPLVN